MFKIRKVMAIILALAMTLSMFNVGIVAADTGATDETATGGGYTYSGTGWAFYEGQYTDTNGEVYQSNTVVITTTTAVTGFYSALNSKLKEAYPEETGIPAQTHIQNVIFDIEGETRATVSSVWTSIMSISSLESITVRNVKTVNGPSKTIASKVLKSLIIENCGSVGKMNSHVTNVYLSFADQGKVVVKDCDSIGDYAFVSGSKRFDLSKAIPGLTYVEIENVKTIGQGAFAGNTDLKDVKVSFTDPNLKGTIKSYAFYRCPNLANVHFNLEGCTSLATRIFGADTGSPDTDFTVDNYKKDNTTVAEDPFYDQLKNNPFKEEELTDEEIIGLYNGDFELEPTESITLGPDESYTSSKVGEALSDTQVTQVTKSARWAENSDSTAEVALKFDFGC